MTRSRLMITGTAILASGALAIGAGSGLAASGPGKGGSDDPIGHDADDDRGGERGDRSRDDARDLRARRDRREIRRAGRCTGSSRAKIKVKDEDRRRIELEFEVDQNRNGQRWGVVVKRNARVILRRAYRTRPPSGSFEARKITRDGAGRERFLAVARNPRTGERCVARVTF